MIIDLQIRNLTDNRF